MGAPVAANGLNANTAVSGANGSARRQSLLVTSCLAAAGVAAAFVAVYPSSALANCPSTTINANASVTQAWATCSLINNATISVGAGPGVTVTGSVLGALTNNGSIGGADAILFGSGVSAGTINNTSTIGPSSGSGISISSATLGALTNSGQIVAPNAGVTLGGGGAITSIANTSSGTIIGSLTAIVVNGGTLGALSNTGSISGSVGVGLKSGGISSIVNSTGGKIIGSAQGIVMTGGALGTIANSGGTITGGLAGVSVSSGTLTALTNSGSISSSATGLLVANGGVVVNGGDLGTVSNIGVITSSVAGVDLESGSIGSIVNTSIAPGTIGTISGSFTGIAVKGGTLGTLTNSGAISGADAILVFAGSVSSINNSGVISGDSLAVIEFSGGVVGTVTNSGSISGGLYYGVQVSGGSVASIANAGGVISGSLAGLFVGPNGPSGAASGAASIVSTISAVTNSGTIGVVSNSGTISGGTVGVSIGSGGAVASITNNGGTIWGGQTGIAVGSSSLSGAASIGALSNSGKIYGNDAGIVIGVGGGVSTIANSAGGQIIANSVGVVVVGSLGALSNSGSISGGSTGVLVTGGALGVLSNSGFIGNNFSGPNGVKIGFKGSDGVVVDDGGSLGALTNAGFIEGIVIGDFGYKAVAVAQAIIPGSITSIVNSVGGTIAGFDAIAVTDGALGGLTNSGTIEGGDGVFVAPYGVVNTIANNAGGLIGGFFDGIDNDGTIGTISNSGLIVSTYSYAAIYNGGSISTISNTGTIISASSAAIYNDGRASIGAITNSGTITGYTGIYNLGTIGQLINTVTLTGSVALFNGASSTTGGRVVGSIGRITNSGVIVGVTGIYNAGSIGTIINTGTILATVAPTPSSNGVITAAAKVAAASNAAIWDDVGGSIGLLSNSGLISGPIGILDAGSISTLNNAGVITGPTAILLQYSRATIGQFSNTGTIAGNIVNGSGRDLTIAGGSGPVYGSLTGLNGSIGTIVDTVLATSRGSISIVPEFQATPTGGDVTVSGNMLLNDILILGSHKLVNAGALQVNNAISITGGFSQSSGGLISGVASPTKYGQLLVSGTAALTGGLVGLQPLSAGILATGQTYTLVQASTLTVSSIIAQVASFSATISTVTAGAFEDLVLTVGAPLSGDWTSVGQKGGGPANPIGVLLDQIAGGSSAQQQQFQAQILTVLSGLTLAQQEHALEQLSPNQMVALSNVAVSSPALNAILQHLDVFAQARGDFELASLSDDAYGDVYGEQGRGLWGKIVGGGAIRTDTAAAYGSSDYGLVFGADVYRSSRALWGVTASWLHANITGHGDQTGSTNAVDSYQLTAYGAYKPLAWGGHWLISGQAAYAYNRYDQTRHVDAFAVTARAGYTGQQYLANGVVGYIFNRQGYNLTAYTGLREVHVANAHYIENGAGLLDMQVSALALDSVTQETGLKYDGVASWRYGKLYPDVSVGWAHDYTNGPIPITGSLAGVTFVEPSKRTSPDGLALAAGVNAQLRGWSIGLDYQGELRSDFQSHTAAIKANFRF